MDASYGGDIRGRRFTTGCVVTIMVAAAPVNSRRKTRCRVNEAGYIAVCRATQEVVFLFLRYLLSTLNVEQHQPTTIYQENEGAISNAEVEISSMRSRHVNNKYHYAREQLKRESIRKIPISRKEQPTDILTKNVDVVLMSKLRKLMLGMY